MPFWKKKKAELPVVAVRPKYKFRVVTDDRIFTLEADTWWELPHFIEFGLSGLVVLTLRRKSVASIERLDAEPAEVQA